MTQHLNRLILFITLVAILCLATAVRGHQLDGQSLWYDEGVAFAHSQRSLTELIPRLRDNVHVPAYFGSLALWEDVTGASEFALRYYSLLWSVLSVAATYALGKRLFAPIAGIAAALFVALNTFSIYYAQEARMYAMLTAVAIVSMAYFVVLIQRSGRSDSASPRLNRQLTRQMLFFGILNALGLYTHISFALVMLAQGALAVIQLLLLSRPSANKHRSFSAILRVFVVYSGASLVTIALFSPWIPTALSQIGAQPNISDVVPLNEMARILQGWLSFGRTYELALGGMSSVIYFLLLFGLIIWPGQRSQHLWTMLVPVVWVVVSVGVYLYFGLYERYLRFLLPTQIAVALWLGRGIWIIWQIQPRQRMDKPVARWRRNVPQAIAIVTIVAYSAALWRGLDPLYNNAAQQRDDYRGLLATIQREAGPNDALVVSAPGLQEVVGYYHDSDLPVFPLPGVEDPAELAAQYETLFVIFYGETEQDPARHIETTLTQTAYPVDSRWFGDPRLLRYAAPVDDLTTVTNDQQFGDALALEAAAIDSMTQQPGDAVRIQLTWLPQVPITQSLVVFVHLLNEEGTLVAQRDSVPLNGLWPTNLWHPDEQVMDRHGLYIPEDLPAGNYTLWLGLYDPATAERLPLGDGDALELATIRVE